MKINPTLVIRYLVSASILLAFSAILFAVNISSTSFSVTQPRQVYADNCYSFAVLANNDTGCTGALDPWANGYYADCNVCIGSGGSDGGGGGINTGGGGTLCAPDVTTCTNVCGTGVDNCGNTCGGNACNSGCPDASSQSCTCPSGLDGSSASCCPSGTSWNGSACVTGTICTPTTCQAQNQTCGTLDDGCNHTLTCGSSCVTPPPTCTYSRVNQGCPSGYSGSDIITTSTDCSTSEANTCTPPPTCTPSTVDNGCPSGYIGSDTVTTYTNCSTTENNTCTLAPPPASVTLTSSPSNISCNQTATLTWSSAHATTCGTINSGTVTGGATSGSMGNVSAGLYQIQCTGPGGPGISVINNNSYAACQASLSVSSNLSAGWTVNGTSGSGSNAITVNPSLSGTSYTITPASVTGYIFPPAITNSDGGGSSMMLWPGDAKTFSLSYTLAPPPFNYSLSNSGSKTITKGGRPISDSVAITKNSISGSQPVSLSLSGVPSSIAYTISAPVCSPTCISNIVFTVDPSTTVGTYPITVTGSPLNRTTSFSLVILKSPDIIVSCSASPRPALIGQPVTWTGTASGGSGLGYTYSWTGTSIPTPAPTTNPFSVTYSTLGVKSAQLKVTDSLSNTGICDPAGTVQVNFNPVFKEF